MAYHTRRRSGRNSEGAGAGGGGILKSCNNCLICAELIEENETRKVTNLSREIGRKPVDVFLKICELLEIPFVEVQGDWDFDLEVEEEDPIVNGSTTNFKLPLCLFCLNDFKSVIKLQQQLMDIQKRIENQIKAIHNKIKDAISSNPGGRGRADDEKVIHFRHKALADYHGSIVSSNNFKTTSQPPSQDFLSSTQESFPIFTTTSSQQESFSSTPNPIYSTPEELKLIDDGPPPDNDDYFDSDVDSPSPQAEGQDSKPDFKTLKKRPKQVNNTIKKSHQPEYFSPVTTDPSGKMIFEGIVITPSAKGYICGQCGSCIGKSQDSTSLRKVKIHIKGVHLGAYTCLLCTKNFTSNDILNQHLVRTHERGHIPCPICGKTVQDRNLLAHQYTHMNATEKAEAVASGLVKLKNKPELRLPCKICGKLFRKNNARLQHELTHIDPEFRRDFKCPHCKDRAYSCKQSLDDHIRKFHEKLNVRKSMCKVCGKSVFANCLRKHMLKHNRIGYPCKFCGKVIRSKLNHQNHEEKCEKNRQNENGFEFDCDICGKFFETRKDVVDHRRKVHKSHWKNKVPPRLAETVSVDNPEEVPFEELNNEGIQHVEGNVYSYQLYNLEKLNGGIKGWKCLTSTCLEEFEEKMDEDDVDLEEKVMEHIRSKHMGSFRCNTCTKKMRSLYEMKVHIRMEHENVRTYDCKICGEMGIMLKRIKRHAWTHKNVWEVAEAVNSGERFPSQYSTCKTQRYLKEMGVEVNLECGICKKNGFDKVEDLFGHRMKEHPEAPAIRVSRDRFGKKPGRPRINREGPVECPQCGTRIINERRLKDHIKYVCNKRRKRSDPGAYGGNGKLGGGGGLKKVCRRKRRRKVKIIVEEDGDEDVDCSEDRLVRVEIKEEVITSEDSTTSEEEEEEEAVMGGKNEMEGNGRSLRDRSSLRRASYKDMKYEDDDDEESSD